MYSHQLETFLAVCRCGSFTKAAKEGFMTAPALIQQINLLENRIGIKLFLRSKHGLTLTPAGKILNEEAPKLIHHADEIKRRMQEATAQRHIRLGWSTGMEDPRFLSECLSLRDSNEQIQIDLTRITDDLFTSLQNNAFDICMHAELSAAMLSGYEFTSLYKVRQCLVVPPGHPLENRTSLELEDLIGLELVILAPGILRDHDEFRELVRSRQLPIRLREVQNYDFETRADCFRQQLPFLGMESLAHQYAPLVCVPGKWDIQVNIGLISQKTDWADLQLLVKTMKEVFRKPVK